MTNKDKILKITGMAHYTFATSEDANAEDGVKVFWRESMWGDECKHFLHDHNATCAAVRDLPVEFRPKYAESLRIVVSEKLKEWEATNPDWAGKFDAEWFALNPSPEMRVDALIRTIP